MKGNKKRWSKGKSGKAKKFPGKLSLIRIISDEKHELSSILGFHGRNSGKSDNLLENLRKSHREFINSEL